VPQYGDNGNWKSWNGTAYADSGKPWKGEKGDTGPSFEYGESYDTLADLQAAYPSGDTKGHLVGGTAYVWDGTAWVATNVDLSDYDKRSVADAKYASVNHTHTAAQVHARADDWMPTAAQIGGIFPYSDCGDVETDLNTLVIPGLYKVNNYKAIHTFYSYSGKYEYIIVSSEGLNSATVQLAFLCTPETSLAAYVTIRATTDCITWTTTVSNADLSQLSNTLAKADLSNITNAIFKAKAESAGVGGGYVRQSTAPTNTSLLWMDSANSNIMKYYNGTAWTPQPSVWGPET
jgi:hypothetical protein